MQLFLRKKKKRNAHTCDNPIKNTSNNFQNYLKHTDRCSQYTLIQNIYKTPDICGIVNWYQMSKIKSVSSINFTPGYS